jgi:hypothetical protein
MLRVARFCINVFGPYVSMYVFSHLVSLSFFLSFWFDGFCLSRLLFSFNLSVLLPDERVCIPACALHDIGCVVETYWLPIGRPSWDASRRPSICPYHPPHVSHVPFIDIHDIFYDSSILSAAYTLHLLFYYHYR